MNSPLIKHLVKFDGFGQATRCFKEGGVDYFVNEYWTAKQRQSAELHEVSYRACFKAELPRFFIQTLTQPKELVYDPFMGRGTTLLEAAILGRKVAGNDINPLSCMLIRPRLNPPTIEAVAERLSEIDWERISDISEFKELRVFYHLKTLREIASLRAYLIARSRRGKLDVVDEWIRLVAINRLTGHSPGFFSVYTLPPNQAVSVDSQKRINSQRNQKPPYRDVAAIILKKSRSLLGGFAPAAGFTKTLMTGPAWKTPQLKRGEVSLIVTSPPFLNIVNYKQDNWLRCWFAGINPDSVKTDNHRTVEDWEKFVHRCFVEFARVVKPGGHVAFEVGEVRGGKILLERNVLSAVADLPFHPLGVMVNDQKFTKTANCWGVSNNSGGTNTNRIVLFQRQ